VTSKNFTIKTIRCIERFDAAFQVNRMIQCQRHWPEAGIEFRRFGKATAIRVAADFPRKNVVVDFDASQLANLPEIISYFREVNKGFVFTLPFESLDSDTFDALCRLGFRCDESSHVMAVLPNLMEWTAGVTVRRSPVEEREAYLDLYRQSFATQRTVTETEIQFQWLNDCLPRAQRFVAEIDGQPAGMAAMNIHEGGAYLSTAGVLPSYRGRSVHQALVAARVNAAFEVGCEVAFGGGHIFSPAMRNLGRCGFRLLPLGVTWYLSAS